MTEIAKKLLKEIDSLSYPEEDLEAFQEKVEELLKEKKISQQESYELFEAIQNAQTWFDDLYITTPSHIKDPYLKDSHVINDIIKETSEGYVIYSEKGKRLSKAYKTMKEAEARLKEIEMFKHMKKDALEKPELFGKKVKVIVNNALSNTIDRMYGSDIISREVKEKNIIEYILPYDGRFDYFTRRFHKKYEVVDSYYKGYGIEKKEDLYEVWKYYTDDRADEKFGGDFVSIEEAEEYIDNILSTPLAKKEKMAKPIVRKFSATVIMPDDSTVFVEKEAKDEVEAKRKIKSDYLGENILIRDLHEIKDSKKELKDNMKLPHLDALIKKLNAPTEFEFEGKIETEPSSYHFEYRIEGDLLKIYDKNENYTIDYADDLYWMQMEMYREFGMKKPKREEIVDKIHPQIEKALKEDGFEDEVLEWENNVIMSIYIPEKMQVKDSIEHRFVCESYFGKIGSVLEDEMETEDLSQAKSWIWDKSQQGYTTRIIDKETGEVWPFKEIYELEELEEIQPYEETNPHEIQIWAVEWFDKKGNKFRAEFDAEEDAKEYKESHKDEEHIEMKIREESKFLEDTALYIYQFPEDMTKEDIAALKDYHLEYLGVVGPNGFQPGDHAVVGKLEDLKKYCKEFIGGYEMHPDYLYKQEDFAEEVLIKK